VLDTKEISEIVADEISRVAQLCDVNFSQAGAILKTFNWDSERLLENYWEDPDKVKKAAGVMVRTKSADLKGRPVDCPICFDTITAKNSCSAECGHAFCNECWGKHLELKITEGESVSILCMAHKCRCLVSEDVVRSCTRPDIYRRYVGFLAKAFVDDHPNIKWCPAPGCGNAVRSDLRSAKLVTCHCGFRFCFMCSTEAHAPASCDEMIRWKKKCADDSETFNWLKVNTQICPKCKTSIEKNGGCNHMTCAKCRHEFCWICNGDWKNHQSCNKFQGSKDTSDDRAALERYLHYYHRFTVHENSKNLEGKLRERAVHKMIELRQMYPERNVDVSYVDRAVEQLIECRRTLKHTYVFAFYLPVGSAEKNLFEYLQAGLETATETLSGLLESKETSDVNEKKRCLDVTLAAHKRLKHLLEGVEEGLTEVPLSAAPTPAPQNKLDGKPDVKPAKPKAARR
jgi:ariadne-1